MIYFPSNYLIRFIPEHFILLMIIFLSIAIFSVIEHIALVSR